MNRGNRILLLLLMIAGCFGVSGKEKNPASALPAQAKWISNCSPVLTDEAAMYANHPSPLFRKVFALDHSTIRKATLYITAAGYYAATLNGERIGDIYLDPAWTNYSKRVYYSQYDLTEKLKSGNNCLGVSLGNGFYNPLPLRMWGNLNIRKSLPTGIPAFIARLVVEYKNGKTAEIVTDNSWRFTEGPLLKNSVYLGEWYDARQEIAGWNAPGLNDASWAKACVVDGPGGKLQSRFFAPVKVTDRFTPAKIESTAKGIYLADMGTNFAGTYKIRLKGHPGDTVTFCFGERIYENGSLNPMTTACGQIKGAGIGGPGAPDFALQTDSYVFGKDTVVWYSPRFTFHTFRYMEIKGLGYQPQLSDIEGLALNSAVEESNHFECSSPILNAIQKISTRTFKSNLVSVESDCPARERFGYGGDINAVADSYIYNFGMHDFYKKAVHDWVDAMNDSIFVDTAPFIGLAYCGISWESAFLFMQDKLYEYYNDTEIVCEMYARDLKWMDKVARLHPGLIVDNGLGDHESMIPVPVQITGTCHYLQAAGVMKRFAALMHDKANEKRFSKLEAKLRAKLQETYWKKPGADVEKVNKQTLYSALLYSGAIAENVKKAVADSLIAVVKRSENGHFTTGIFGTKYILNVLSQAGMTQQVFDIVNSPAFPGWGYMVNRGATTLWEAWRESDNTYSNCHPMFGSVSEWFYRWLGGISPDEKHPGFQQFYLKPHAPVGLNFVKTSYKTPFGVIRSDWERKTTGEIVYNVSVPKGTIASFQAEASKNAEVTVRLASKIVGQQNVESCAGHYQTKLNAGDYEIVIK
ncbi:MAG: family 78 glycoside hydrolase catalytic domain [Bacteroidota bacterium]|nr:family 78 glycoside hydrolase catalytic domain [Bacteroidota bacterium]